MLPLVRAKPSNAGDNLRFASHHCEYIRSSTITKVMISISVAIRP
jgi:hypothetical protein